jgi:hypothetical protein
MVSSAWISTRCPFHGSMRLACRITTSSAGVCSCARSPSRSGAPASTGGTGGYTTSAGTPLHSRPSDSPANRLVQMARSGRVRLARRSAQVSPVTLSCSQNTRGMRAWRTTGANTECVHVLWQITTCGRRVRRACASRRRARNTVQSRLIRTGPNTSSGAPAARTSSASRPSKQSANAGSIPACVRIPANCASIRSTPPYRLPA